MIYSSSFKPPNGASLLGLFNFSTNLSISLSSFYFILLLNLGPDFLGYSTSGSSSSTSITSYTSVFFFSDSFKSFFEGSGFLDFFGESSYSSDCSTGFFLLLFEWLWWTYISSAIFFLVWDLVCFFSSSIPSD